MKASGRLWAAMACYGVLALAAGVGLWGKVRLVVLVLLAGLAVKTWIGEMQRTSQDGEGHE